MTTQYDSPVTLPIEPDPPTRDQEQRRLLQPIHDSLMLLAQTSGGGGGGGWYFQATPPASPAAGDRWVKTTTGIEYTWVTDANSSQWVEIGPYCGGGAAATPDFSVQFNAGGRVFGGSSDLTYNPTTKLLTFGVASKLSVASGTGFPVADAFYVEGRSQLATWTIRPAPGFISSALVAINRPFGTTTYLSSAVQCDDLGATLLAIPIGGAWSSIFGLNFTCTPGIYRTTMYSDGNWLFGHDTLGGLPSNPGYSVEFRKQVNFSSGSRIFLSGSAGTTGQVLTSQGAGAPPVWSTSGIPDGDKGDITVSGSGSVWTIDSQTVTYPKIQNVSANSVLARASGTAGVVNEVTLNNSELLGRGLTGNISPITLGAGLSMSGSSLVATGSQAALQLQDEGTNLGAAGTVDTLDFVGSTVSAARSGNKVTVTVSPGGGQTSVQFKDEGTNLGAAGTVDTLDFVGAGVTASRIGNTVTVSVPGGGGGGGLGTIVDINGVTGLTGWWSAQDLPGLGYSSGNPVVYWNNRAASGIDAFRAGRQRAPIYLPTAGPNSQPCIHFNTPGQALSLVSARDLNSAWTPLTIFMISAHDFTGQVGPFLIKGAEQQFEWYCRIPSTLTNHSILWNNLGGVHIAIPAFGSNPVGGTFYLTTIQFSSVLASSAGAQFVKGWRNGGAGLASTTVVSSPNGRGASELALTCTGVPTAPGTTEGKVCEVAIFSRILTNTELNNVATTLCAPYLLSPSPHT